VVLSAINEFFTSGKISDSLSGLLKSLNEFIISKKLDGRFVTAFFGIYDNETSELEYLSLGHEPCVLFNNNDYTLIESDYMPIGIMTEEYTTKNIKISKNQKLFIYSDGIIEYIEYEQLYEYLLKNNHLSSQTLISSLYDKLVGDDKDNQKDDFTCLILKF
jgi:sigma-B regulation protein RsbU (phosphoserine phosphatase)